MGNYVIRNILIKHFSTVYKEIIISFMLSHFADFNYMFTTISIAQFDVKSPAPVP